MIEPMRRGSVRANCQTQQSQRWPRSRGACSSILLHIWPRRKMGAEDHTVSRWRCENAEDATGSAVHSARRFSAPVQRPRGGLKVGPYLGPKGLAGSCSRRGEELIDDVGLVVAVGADSSRAPRQRRSRRNVAVARTLRARRQLWVKWVDLTGCLLVAAVVTAVVAHLARNVWMFTPTIWNRRSICGPVRASSPST